MSSESLVTLMELRALDRQLAANAELGARNRILFSSVDSTNRFGKRIAAHYRQVGESLPETVILALAQSNGRGRLGHVWLSPPGGVYISLVWPVGDPARLSELPMRVVTNVCREVNELVDGTCRVKWPNDLLVGGRKVGGILIETVGHGESLVVIVGLGLNHSGDLAGLPPNATNLAAEATGLASFGDVAGQMMTALVASLVDSEGVEAVIEDYSRWSQHEIGQELRCRTTRESFSGTFLGFDRRGFLRLRTTTGDRLVTAGEIIEGEEANHHEAQ